LNVNVDTFAVIDDSPFERAEISSALPQVRVYDPATAANLLEREEFDVPISSLSRGRRAAYAAEARRRQTAAARSGSFEKFLRSCNMVMRIGIPQGERVERCVELLQRSNQFNLSGSRYSIGDLEALLSSVQHECFAFELADDYGDYGVVGFAAVRLVTDRPLVTDFVMSCRVAQKKADETFLYWYASRAQRRGAVGLWARLMASERNAPLRNVLSALPFERISARDHEEIFAFEFAGPIAVPRIIRIEEH
jgi:FkbH-like protein